MISAIARRVASVLLLILVALPWPAAAVEVQRVVSPGGIEAWLVEDHNVPVLAVSFAFRDAGAAYDPEARRGLANMVSGLLDEGAGDLDSQSFQKRLADLSISLGFNAGRDDFTGSLATLTENREEAVRLLALALTEPRFDPEPVARVRDQILIALARRSVDPSSLAYRTWFRLMFGAHPYGRPTDGETETVAAIQSEDLHRFVAERFARDNLIVGVAGDVTAAELAVLLDRAFGGLPPAPTPRRLPEVERLGTGELVVVERPVPQSIAVFGHGGLRREDPDWYAALILNYVLGGGGFSSRLTEEVREKRGLAYGVSTSLYPLDRGGLVLGQVATQNDRVAQSIEIIRAEWRRFAEDGPTPEEVAAAKAYLIGSFPISLDSTRRIAATLVSIQENALGIDYLDRRKALIEGVTPEDLKRVAGRLFRAEDLTFVVVGSPTELRPTREPPHPG